ncbi:MAG TPA: hypothetical protein VGF08_00325, partial [Terriglobales bacterium]
TVTSFLTSRDAVKAIRSAHMDPERVKVAISNLNEQELAQLASRVDQAHSDFAAGTLSDRDLIIILLAIAALVLIIVAVR